MIPNTAAWLAAAGMFGLSVTAIITEAPERPPSAMIASTDVAEVCATDGLPGSAYSRRMRVVARKPVPGHQVDHIVPLCLGGADVDANIQIQPIEEALEKDEHERRMCRAVCAGKMPLAEAQRWFIEERWRR